MSKQEEEDDDEKEEEKEDSLLLLQKKSVSVRCHCRQKGEVRNARRSDREKNIDINSLLLHF